MKTIIRGGTRTLYWAQGTNGFRLMSRMYATSDEYVFSWSFPYFNYRTSFFYCADLIAAMNTIRNSATYEAQRVYYVSPGTTPADDQYQDRYFFVAGRKLSSFPVVYARCQITQSQNMNLAIPQLAAPLNFTMIPSGYPYHYTNAINIPSNAGRTKENALCSFYSNTIYIETLRKES